MTIPCTNCGHVPHYKDRERQQEPYRGMWQALVAWECERHQLGHPIYVGDFRAKLHEIVEQRPAGVDAFAVNTPRYGRALDEIVEEAA